MKLTQTELNVIGKILAHRILSIDKTLHEVDLISDESVQQNVSAALETELNALRLIFAKIKLIEQEKKVI